MRKTQERAGWSEIEARNAVLTHRPRPTAHSREAFRSAGRTDGEVDAPAGTDYPGDAGSLTAIREKSSPVP
jgi:hypothetical protein